MINPVVATDHNHDHLVVSDRWSDRVERPTALPQLTAHADARCGADSVRHLAQSHPSPGSRLLSSLLATVSRSRLTVAARRPAPRPPHHSPPPPSTGPSTHRSPPRPTPRSPRHNTADHRTQPAPDHDPPTRSWSRHHLETQDRGSPRRISRARHRTGSRRDQRLFNLLTRQHWPLDHHLHWTMWKQRHQARAGWFHHRTRLQRKTGQTRTPSIASLVHREERKCFLSDLNAK